MPENDAPSIAELEAKTERLQGDVREAEAAYGVAKQTFADAAQSDPTAVEKLLELSQAVAAAKATVGKANAAVQKNADAIAGIQYDESMSAVTEASGEMVEAIRPLASDWFDTNEALCGEFAIDTLAISAKREESGAIAVSVKPTGANMPKRPGTRRTGDGERGPRGTRNVTFTENGIAPSRAGETVSCREYVAACGDQASPAAQADLAGQWEGSPVSYTNEAKRLAAKNNDTFA